MDDLKLLNKYIQLDEFFYQKDDVVSAHSSLWGEFNLSLNGILEYDIEQQRYLSPPHYGVWIPPQTAHASLAIDNQTTRYVCIRLHPQLAQHFDQHVQSLQVSPFLRALILELLAHSHKIRECQQVPEKIQQYLQHQQHLLAVLLDQLISAPRYEHYLPSSHHPLLAPILAKLSDSNLFHCSLQQILQDCPLSERHLLRLCQQELQLSLSQWRDRAKMIYAINQLHQGSPIKRIALDLGYQHPSSFTEFFKRYTGHSPAQFLQAL